MSGLNIFIIVLLIVLLILSAFFSAAETAYSTVNKTKVERDARKGKKVARLIKKQHNSFGWIFATILLSNNIVNVALSALTTTLLSLWLTEGTSSAIISIAIVTPIIVIFGEVTPKIFAKKFAYSYLKKVAYILEILNWLFLPITYPLSKIALSSKVTNTENELDFLIDVAKNERVLDANEAALAQRALDLDSRVVSSIMVNKANIVSISSKENVLKAKKKFASSGHSRLIVKTGNTYVGVLLLKDVILMKDKSLFTEQIKQITFVSKSKLVSKALEKMRIQRSHIALVVEKKGSKTISGLLTIEDILEELVGEIYDEHDGVQSIREIAHFKYVVDGSTPMKSLSKHLEFKFEDTTDLTVKQWVQSRIQRHIKKGLRYEYKDTVSFKIIENKKSKETLIEIIVKH